jgi:hypothetical protein
MSNNQSQDSDILVPFEQQTFSDDYKRYYSIKRNNLFATIQKFPELWEYYQRLDKIWYREIEDLKPAPRDSQRVFPLMLYINAHAKMRISIELALAGCLAEARSILRDGVECVAHAHFMLSDPKLQRIWLSKNDGQAEQRAFEQAFKHKKLSQLFKGLGELYEMWGQLSETGSHVTTMSICDRFKMRKNADGSQEWGIVYSGGMDERTWCLSLFTMLLACFTMENTFYKDYEDRLKLDYELVRMRAEFEVFKEQLRRTLIVRYKIPHPSAKGASTNP